MLQPLFELATIDQARQRIVAGLIHQPCGGLVDLLPHLVLHGLQVRRHVIDAALQDAQFGRPALFHPLVQVALGNAAHRVGQAPESGA